MLYTLNPDFRTDRSTTARRTAIAEHLRERSEYYGIDGERIVYMGAQTGEKRTFVAESSVIVEDFLVSNAFDYETIVFHDAGNAFKRDGESIFDVLRMPNHHCYPPPVHMFLSPNDNRLHAVAKRKWRSVGLDYSDDVDASLALLRCIDDVSADAITRMWDRNLFMPDIADRKAALSALVGGVDPVTHQHFVDCRELYERSMRRPLRSNAGIRLVKPFDE